MNLLLRCFKTSFDNYLYILIMNMLMIIASLEWFIEETMEILVPADTIENHFHHGKPPTHFKSDLNLPKIQGRIL